MSAIYSIIALTILVGLSVAFIVLLANKTEVRYKIRDQLDSQDIRLIAKMFDCDFCFCFWLSVFISIIIIIIFNEYYFIFIPIFSTPIARFLL